MPIVVDWLIFAGFLCWKVRRSCTWISVYLWGSVKELFALYLNFWDSFLFITLIFLG